MRDIIAAPMNISIVYFTWGSEKCEDALADPQTRPITSALLANCKQFYSELPLANASKNIHHLTS